MSKFENAVAKAYEKQGWEVLRSGWPDMLLVRRDAAGKLELKAVEVKADGDSLRPNQQRMCAALSTVITVRDVHQGAGYGNTFKVYSDEEGDKDWKPGEANTSEKISQWRRLHRTSAHELVYNIERYEVYEKGPRFE